MMSNAEFLAPQADSPARNAEPDRDVLLKNTVGFQPMEKPRIRAAIGAAGNSMRHEDINPRGFTRRQKIFSDIRSIQKTPVGAFWRLTCTLTRTHGRTRCPGIDIMSDLKTHPPHWSATHLGPRCRALGHERGVTGSNSFACRVKRREQRCCEFDALPRARPPKLRSYEDFCGPQSRPITSACNR